jgi:hypothetical protein
LNDEELQNAVPQRLQRKERNFYWVEMLAFVQRWRKVR